MGGARSKRKAKEKANKRKRAAAGDVVNPYAAVENEEGSEGEDAQPLNQEDIGDNDDGSDDIRPKTSGSDASGEILVGAHHETASAAAVTEPTPTPADGPSTGDDPPKEDPQQALTPAEWSYDPLPSTDEPIYPDEDPDEPLTEAELRLEEIKDWFAEQKGHAYSFKKISIEKLADFVYAMKYEEDRREWMRDCRLVVWRAVVRANFWWRDPDLEDKTPTKPKPILAPSGIYENNFPLFVSCAAERLDRIGRDLPDAEYVKQIEDALRTFFRRAANKNLSRQIEHLAFLILVDEEQNRVLGREDVQARLRMCFDGVKEMGWGGLGAVGMGRWPERRSEAPLRTEGVWRDVMKRFEL